MYRITKKDSYILAEVLVVSFLITFLLFLWQGNKGFNLWDEGFLWYGIQRVLHGEVPIRDFMAYDPGRYYWSASLLYIVGDNGIMGVRATTAVFQALGLFVGLLLISGSATKQEKSNIIFLAISAATLAVWMFPRHKLFDISLSLFLIGTLAYLIQHPTSRRYFVSGICIGLIAVFGRNHGMYGAVGGLAVIVWLNIKHNTNVSFLNGLMLWSAGIIIGFLPIIFMALMIPGFALAFWESIRFLFEQKATNLPLPVPWPWTVNFAVASPGEALRSVLIGIFFMGTLVFGGLAILWVVHQRLKDQAVPPALVATAFLALPYAHFAFSRADIGHLALGIFPLLVGSLVILSTTSTMVKWPLTIGLCVSSFWVMHALHPGWECLSSKQCVNIEVSGSNLLVNPDTANDITLIQRLVKQYAPDGQNFIAAPFWPGAYALMEQRSPMWEIYALFPRSEAFEKKEIERIKASRVSFVFIYDMPLDGRDELRFKNTHPLINQFILDNFDRVSQTPNHYYQIYKARGMKQ